MKKIIFVMAVLSLVSGMGYCVSQPHNIGYAKTDSPFGLFAQTLAQIDALTPDTTSQLIVCSDCKFILCISTGAQSLARGGFVVVGSTVTAATANGATTVPMHCQ